MILVFFRVIPRSGEGWHLLYELNPREVNAPMSMRLDVQSY